MFTPMTNLLPPGTKGEAKIEHFTISESDAERSKTREVASQGKSPALSAGTYAKLEVGGQLVMSDTQFEHETNEDLLLNAHGRVLIAGLGLGMVLVPLLADRNVDLIVVVEKSKDVIDLVSPAFKEAIEDDRLILLHEDIFEWKPGPEWVFDTIYFDIWPNLSKDNLPEMDKLERFFTWQLDDKNPDAWIGSWGRDWLDD